MLAAAAAPEARILQLFRLALDIAVAESTVPAQLIEYFNRVLSQARALDRDPSSKVESVMPEAIQLALDIRERAELRQAVSDIQSFNDVSPNKAAEVLRQLEALGAA
jgi:hypothetical protein